jgi:hypothetical protein
LNHRRDCALDAGLVLDDNEETGVRLTGSKHATSEGSSDAFRRAVHRYEGDENDHCDDGADWRDDAELFYENDGELNERDGFL